MNKAAEDSREYLRYLQGIEHATESEADISDS